MVCFKMVPCDGDAGGEKPAVIDPDAVEDAVPSVADGEHGSSSENSCGVEQHSSSEVPTITDPQPKDDAVLSVAEDEGVKNGGQQSPSSEESSGKYVVLTFYSSFRSCL